MTESISAIRTQPTSSSYLSRAGSKSEITAGSNITADSSESVYKNQWKTNYLKYYRYNAASDTFVEISPGQLKNRSREEICAFVVNPFYNDGRIVSEGMAWGMLMAATFNEPDTFKYIFNGLKKMQKFGLPSCKVYIKEGRLEISGADRSSASDADQDATYALILAWNKVKKCQWKNFDEKTLRDYIGEFFLQQIYKDEIQYNGISYLLKPSEDWGASGIGVGTAVNISYPSASIMEAFQNFDREGGHLWGDVARSVLTLRKKLILGDDNDGFFSIANPESKSSAKSKKPYSPPDWVAVGRFEKENLFYQIPDRSIEMGADGIRTFWRIAFDAVFGDNNVRKNSIELARRIIVHYKEKIFPYNETQQTFDFSKLSLNGYDQQKSKLFFVPIFAALAKAACQPAYSGETVLPEYSEFLGRMNSELAKLKGEYEKEEFKNDYYLNSLMLLSRMVLDGVFERPADQEKMWDQHPVRSIAALAEKYPGFRSGGATSNIFYDLRYSLFNKPLNAPAARNELGIIQNAFGWHYSNDFSKPQGEDKLLCHYNLANQQMGIEDFFGAFEGYLAIINGAAYPESKEYLALAADGLIGAYLRSGMSPHIFLRFVEDLTNEGRLPKDKENKGLQDFLNSHQERYPYNEEKGILEVKGAMTEDEKKQLLACFPAKAQKKEREIINRLYYHSNNPYIDLVRINANLLTYDPERFQDCLNLYRGLVKKCQEKQIADPLLNARILMTLAEVHLGFLKDQLDFGKKDSLLALMKMAGGEQLSLEERNNLIKSGIVSQDELEYFEPIQKKLSDALKIGFSNYFKEYTDPQEPYQTEDTLTYLLDFEKAQIYLRLADDKSLKVKDNDEVNVKKDKEGQIINYLTAAEAELYKVLAGLPEYKKQDSVRVAINAVKALTHIYRSLYGINNNPAFLSLAKLIPEYFLKEAFAAKEGEASLDKIIKLRASVEVSSEEIKKGLLRAEKIISGNKLKPGRHPVRFLEERFRYQESVDATGYLNESELNLRIERIRAAMAESKLAQNDIMNQINQLQTLFPRNRVRQVVDRIYFYLVEGEKEKAREYLDEINSLVQYLNNVSEERTVAVFGTSGMAQADEFENSLRLLTRSIREIILAKNDFEKFDAEDREALEACVEQAGKIIHNCKAFWTGTEKENFEAMVKKFEKLVQKIGNAENKNIQVKNFLEGIDIVSDLADLADKAEVIFERLRFLRHLAGLIEGKKSFQFQEEVKLLKQIEEFREFAIERDSRSMDYVYRYLMNECEACLRESSYSQQVYQDMLQIYHDLGWYLAGDRLGRYLSSNKNDAQGNLDDAEAIICEILDLPFSKKISEDAKKLINFMRDPEFYGMKSRLFIEKPYLKKEFYLLLSAIQKITGNVDAAETMNRTYYLDPNDFQVFEWAGKLFPDKLGLKFDPAKARERLESILKNGKVK